MKWTLLRILIYIWHYLVHPLHFWYHINDFEIYFPLIFHDFLRYEINVCQHTSKSFLFFIDNGTLPLESLSHEKEVTTELTHLGLPAVGTTTARSVHDETEGHVETTSSEEPGTEDSEHGEVQVTQVVHTDQQAPDIHGETVTQINHDQHDLTGTIEQESLPETGESVSEEAHLHHETLTERVPDIKEEKVTTNKEEILSVEQVVTSAEGISDEKIETSTEGVKGPSISGSNQEKLTTEPQQVPVMTTVGGIEQSLTDNIEMKIYLKEGKEKNHTLLMDWYMKQ